MIHPTPLLIHPKLPALTEQARIRAGGNARSESASLSSGSTSVQPTPGQAPSSGVHVPLPPIADHQQALAVTQQACRLFQERSHDALNAQANSSSQRAHVLLS
jgi:hypothetical protein